jgi:hypothetical protein
MINSCLVFFVYFLVKKKIVTFFFLVSHRFPTHQRWVTNPTPTFFHYIYSDLSLSHFFYIFIGDNILLCNFFIFINENYLSYIFLFIYHTNTCLKFCIFIKHKPPILIDFNFSLKNSNQTGPICLYRS